MSNWRDKFIKDANGDPISWDHMPLVYQYSDDCPPLLRSCFEMAIWRIEKRTDLHLFRPLLLGVDETVDVILGPASFPDGPWNPEDEFDLPGGGMISPHPIGPAFRHVADGAVKKGRTELGTHGTLILAATSVVDPKSWFRAVLEPICGHELGHVLGLDEALGGNPLEMMNENNASVLKPSDREAASIQGMYGKIARVHEWPVPSAFK